MCNYCICTKNIQEKQKIVFSPLFFINFILIRRAVLDVSLSPPTPPLCSIVA